MKQLLTILCLFGLLAVGCKTAQKTTPPDRPVAPEAVDDSKSTGDTSGRDLAIWQDPRFEQQFDESYIADTDVEPRITTLEREVMLEVVEALKAGADLEGEARVAKQNEAAQIIRDNYNDASSAVYDFTLGNIYFEQDRLDEAAEAYRTAVSKHRKFRRAWKALGMVYVRQSKWEQAIPVLTKVIELGGGDAITYGLMGFAYSSTNNPVSAESAYRQAILLEPDRPDWKMGLARSFFRQERFADAVALTGKMLETEPDRTDLWMLQANAYLQMGKPMRAAENYLFVEQMGQATPEMMNMLGDIYINQELYGLAVDAYVRALEMSDKAHAEAVAAAGDQEVADKRIKPDRALTAARVLTARGELELAGQMIEEIRDRRDEQLATDQKKELLRMEARMAVARGATDEEAEILKQIIEIDPLDGEALILLGQHATSKATAAITEANLAQAEADNAAEAAEADDATEEQQQEAKRLAAEAERAQSRKAELVARAAFYFERAAAIEKHEADAKVRHAQLLVKTGDYPEALRLLRQAQQVKPRDNVQDYLEQVERVARSR